jgi:hypothetical protein
MVENFFDLAVRMANSPSDTALLARGRTVRMTLLRGGLAFISY